MLFVMTSFSSSEHPSIASSISVIFISDLKSLLFSSMAIHTLFMKQQTTLQLINGQCV